MQCKLYIKHSIIRAELAHYGTMTKFSFLNDHYEHTETGNSLWDSSVKKKKIVTVNYTNYNQ